MANKKFGYFIWATHSESEKCCQPFLRLDSSQYLGVATYPKVSSPLSAPSGSNPLPRPWRLLFCRYLFSSKAATNKKKQKTKQGATQKTEKRGRRKENSNRKRGEEKKKNGNVKKQKKKSQKPNCHNTKLISSPGPRWLRQAKASCDLLVDDGRSAPEVFGAARKKCGWPRPWDVPQWTVDFGKAVE